MVLTLPSTASSLAIGHPLFPISVVALISFPTIFLMSAPHYLWQCGLQHFIFSLIGWLEKGWLHSVLFCHHFFFQWAGQWMLSLAGPLHKGEWMQSLPIPLFFCSICLSPHSQLNHLLLLSAMSKSKQFYSDPASGTVYIHFWESECSQDM
jgi:hypothetical protein